MGLRSRIKARLKGLWQKSEPNISIHREEMPRPSTTRATTAVPKEPEAQSQNTVQSVSVAPEDAESPAPPTTGDTTAASPQVSTAEADTDAAEASEQAAKIARHFEKARKGVLTFMHKAGGESSLADMHGHSERRYFIAHQKFSQLMEGLVEEELVDYSWEDGTARLTDKGQAYIKA